MLSTVSQIGIPGTQELMIFLLMFVLFFAVPLGVIVFVLLFVYRRYKRSDDHVERIEELEREVEALRKERETAPGEPDDQLE